MNTDPRTALHVLVESRGPGRGPGARSFLDDAIALRGTGADVEVYLVQDGVVAAARSSDGGLDAVLEAGAGVFVDDFSSVQRALRPGDLLPGVRITDMAALARRLLTPAVRVVWH